MKNFKEHRTLLLASSFCAALVYSMFANHSSANRFVNELFASCILSVFYFLSFWVISNAFIYLATGRKHWSEFLDLLKADKAFFYPLFIVLVLPVADFYFKLQSQSAVIKTRTGPYYFTEILVYIGIFSAILFTRFLHAKKNWPENRDKSRLTAVLLVVTLMVAFIYRLRVLSDYMPYMNTVDERQTFFIAHEMLTTGKINPNYIHYPAMNIYLHYIFLYFTYAYAHLKGVLSHPSEMLQVIGNPGVPHIVPSVMYYAAKLYQVLFSCGAVWFCYLTGKHLWNRYAGLVGALALAVNAIYVEYTAVLRVDFITSFFCSLTGYVLVRAVKEQNQVLMFLTALCAGFSISSKYNVAPIVFAVLLASFWMKATFANMSRLKYLFYLSLTVFIGFAVISPYVLTQYEDYSGGIAWPFVQYLNIGIESVDAARTYGERFRLMMSTLEACFPVQYFFPVWGVSLLGSFYLAARKKPLYLIFNLFPLLYLMLLSRSTLQFDRNYMPVIPFFAVAAGVILISVTDTIGGLLEKQLRRFQVKAAVSLIVLFFLAKGSLVEARQKITDMRYTGWDSRSMSARFLTEDPAFTWGEGERIFISAEVDMHPEDYALGGDRFVTGRQHDLSPKLIKEKNIRYVITLEKPVGYTVAFHEFDKSIKANSRVVQVFALAAGDCGGFNRDPMLAIRELNKNWKPPVVSAEGLEKSKTFCNGF